MTEANIKNKATFYYFACLVTGLLLFITIFHEIDINHHHPWFLGEGISALAHGEDKKWIVTLASLWFLALLIDVTNFKPSVIYFKAPLQNLIFFKFYNYLLSLLRRGLLNPKPH